MSEPIIIPEYAGDVIKVGGQCYQFAGNTEDPVTDTPTNPPAYGTCEDCQQTSSAAEEPGEACNDPGVCPANCDTCPDYSLTLSGFVNDPTCVGDPGGSNECADLNMTYAEQLIRSGCFWSATSFDPSGSNTFSIACLDNNPDVWELELNIDLDFDSGCWILDFWSGQLEACGDGTCPPLGPYPLVQMGPQLCIGSPVGTLTAV